MKPQAFIVSILVVTLASIFVLTVAAQGPEPSGPPGPPPTPTPTAPLSPTHVPYNPFERLKTLPVYPYNQGRLRPRPPSMPGHGAAACSRARTAVRTGARPTPA